MGLTDNNNKQHLLPALEKEILKNSPQQELTDKSKFTIFETKAQCLIDENDDVRDFIESNGAKNTADPFAINIEYTK